MTNTLDESHWGGPYYSDSHTIITVWVRWHVFKFPFKHLLLWLWLLLLSPLSLFFLENYPKRQQMVTKKLSWDAFLRTWVCAFESNTGRCGYAWEIKKNNTCTDRSAWEKPAPRHPKPEKEESGKHQPQERHVEVLGGEWQPRDKGREDVSHHSTDTPWVPGGV